MKKIFTLALALLGIAGASNASTVDDIAVTKHSYVLVCDDYTGNGTIKRVKGTLFGDSHFLDVTGGSIATNKGSVDLTVPDTLGEDKAPLYVTQEIVDKYGEYGKHLNSLRLKNAQDVIAIKLTAKSKLIFFLQGNNKEGKSARIPKIAKSADLSDALNDAPDDSHPATVSGFRWEYTVADDGLYYIGSYNGDMFVSFIIVEAKEAPGTPTVKVGPQTFENGLWFKEVTCKANAMVEEGSSESIPTVVTYTTDGSTPTAASPKYTEPIKCYAPATVKFQAFMDLTGKGEITDDDICDGADNEGGVSFSFNAPAITSEGANVSITSEYEGAKNFYSQNGGESTEGSSFTLTESATVSAYSEIVNGEYYTFTTLSATKDIYVLNSIKEKKTIAITAGEVVVDEEATAQSTDGSTVYKVKDGAISADKSDFFVKNLTFGVVKDAKYQVPEGEERYIKMSDTNISFQIAAGDSVNVKVVCSKNSCKNIDEPEEEVKAEGSKVADNRKCFVNVNGTNYGGQDLVDNPEGNVIEFGLKAGDADQIFTFQKYSGTGNILISSIEITPVAAEPGIEEKTQEFDLTAASWGWGWGCETSNNEAGNLVGTLTGGWGAISTGWDPTADWSAYKTLVCVIESIESAEAEPYIQILAKGDSDDKKAAYTAISETFTTQKTFEIPLDPAYSGAVKQLWFQGKGVGDKIVVSKVYLTTKEATSAINGVKTVQTEGAIYNLAGQKVNASYKGVVIKNGKKYFQK